MIMSTTAVVRPGDRNSLTTRFYTTENGGYEHDSSSDQTLQERNTSIHTSAENEEPADGGEKGSKGGPSQPVGFWDRRLKKVRLEVFGAWAKTSKKPGCGLFGS